MAIGLAQRIIVEDVNDQIAFNKMDFRDLEAMWTKLKNIYTKVNPRIMY